ncbi:MAG: sigma-70 family RNA polymerase sigma factor [Planctomycetes bacterium]|nr:sigma-70 family RNA polymerase sigma factor [Planctomycetota bacterium]
MSAEQLFLQFRATRDPASLGAVFDLCADELFAVAMHLCRDRQAAEDAVQATFLVAIERAHRFVPGRPLRPWLLGILHREVKRARRRARRVPDAAKVRLAEEPPPPQALLATETLGSVRAAIANVPTPYREVLQLHLEQTLPSGRIAERLQRSPGAVRTQLWRGLELLRRLLPKGLALGAAVELGARPALAAVRDRVTAAATAKGATAAGIGAAALLGGLLMKKVMAAAVVLAAMGLLYWQWAPRRDAPAPASPQDATTTIAAAVADAVEPAPEPSPSRIAVADAPAGAATVPASEPAAEAAPVTMQVLVTDDRGRPVPGADVAVYAAKKDHPDERADGAPARRTTTDVLGRCAVVVRASMLLSARKEGVGWSGDVMLDRLRGGLESECRVVLLPTAIVRGTVLLPDGRPAVGARILAYYTAQLIGVAQTLSGELPPARTDQDGRFECEVLPGKDYRFRAELDGNYARVPGEVDLEPGEVRDVILQFPGAFAVSGTLLDHEERPLAGEVRLLGAGQESVSRATCDAQGRFRMLLTAGGTFDLIGGTPGQTSAHTRLVLDEVRPQQEVTLRTTPFVPVTGKIVDERGQPCAGAHVGLSWAAERSWLERQRNELHGNMARGPTTADGTFSFLAPAGFRYRLVCRALPDSRELWVKGPEFDVPATGLVLAIREVDKQGFVIAGTVVDDEGGAAVPRFSVSRTTHYERGASENEVGKGADGAFEIGPLVTGTRCTFVFAAEGFAKARVGPFDTTVRREVVEVRLRRCGKVRLRVLRADGTPAVRVMTSLQQVVEDPFCRAWQGETDGDGNIEFSDVLPEAFKVHAWVLTQEDLRAVGETFVRPGQTSQVQLVLPR